MRVRSEHWALMLDITEKNPELVTNKFNGPSGKARGHAVWLSTAEKLNCLGFGTKSVDEWRRALIDWKSKTKGKAAKLRLDRESTGGGLATAIPFTELEKRLLAIMGNVAVDGDFGVEEFGMPLKESRHEEIVQTTNVHNKENFPTGIDHSYLKRKTYNIEKPKSKRIRENCKIKMSRDLLQMNEESLDILKNIDTNIRRMADSLAAIAEKFNV